MKELGDKGLLAALAPPSLLRGQKMPAAMAALDEPLGFFAGHLEDGLFLCRIDELSSEVLDHLARQWSAGVWRDSWPLETKRSALKAVITEKRRLGTLAAVKNAVASLGSAAYIREWWQTNPLRTPHTFEVIIDQNGIEGIADEELLDDLKRSIDYAKPVRAQYTVTVTWKTSAAITLAATARGLVSARLAMSPRLVTTGEVRTGWADGIRPLSFTRLTAPLRYPPVFHGVAETGTVTALRAIVTVRPDALYGRDVPLRGEIELMPPPVSRALTAVRIGAPERNPDSMAGTAALGQASAMRVVVSTHRSTDLGGTYITGKAASPTARALRPVISTRIRGKKEH